ncbi:MAG TPA: phage integrase N-terminal SAM-like domain-containing protein [Anaerolineae bacterium]|nr:phage integrase N-terminal SAM-like domain-containing protein [Anaerolineae bacterium]
MSVEQLPLFPGDGSQEVRPPAAAGLDENSPLSAAMERFRQHMQQQEFAENTVKSFLFDLGILARYLKGDPGVGQIGTHDLERFLHWLQHERGKPCSPKSYARRLTTLKVFFAWLAGLGAIPADPAAPLAHKPASAPLPRILDDEQVEQVLAVTRRLAIADEPDARPHLLVTLLLHTGIKKQECMALKLADISTSDAEGPSIRIRYDRPRMEYKERRLRLPLGWSRTLQQYRRLYEPQEFLFPCTARNLEYVLADVAQQAGLPAGLSFEMLRWTCAVRDHKARMEPDHLRRKLGLSQMSWQETEPKLVRLAEPPL